MFYGIINTTSVSQPLEAVNATTVSQDIDHSTGDITKVKCVGGEH